MGVSWADSGSQEPKKKNWSPPGLLAYFSYPESLWWFPHGYLKTWVQSWSNSQLLAETGCFITDTIPTTVYTYSSYFSDAVLEHHDQCSLLKEELISGVQSRVVTVCDGRAKVAGAWGSLWELQPQRETVSANLMLPFRASDPPPQTAIKWRPGIWIYGLWDLLLSKPSHNVPFEAGKRMPV